MLIAQTVMGWVELYDEESSSVCYVKLETGEVSYTRPKRWVLEVTKMFNGGHAGTNTLSMRAREELAREMTDAGKTAAI